MKYTIYRMKIQIVSDLHLEFKTVIDPKIIPSAPILCMVGDICAMGNPQDFAKFKTFLEKYTKKFKYIIHVAGNHEYYSKNATPIQVINNELRALTKTFQNYIFLNNQIFEYKDGNNTYVFCGTTLWTYVPPKLYNEIESKMNDYNQIYEKGPKNRIRQFTVARMQIRHQLAVKFIKDCILKGIGSKKKYILLTHHKPLVDENTNYNNIYTWAYENDLADKILVPPFVVAAHGHTHQHYNRKVNKVHVVSNPKGYAWQRTDWNPAFTVNV